MSTTAQKLAPDPNDDRFDNEVGLLGALLIYADPVLYRTAAAIIGPDHFFDHFNARLFDTIGRGVDAGLSAFKLQHWIISELRDDFALKDLKITASAMVGRYCANAFPAIGVEAASRQAKHDYLKVELNNAVEQGDTAAAETIAAEMERLSKTHLGRDQATELVGDASRKIIAAMSDAYQDWDSIPKHAGTGFHDLTQQIGGWKRGRLYVLAGRPGMGKSTFGLAAMLRTAQLGHGAIMFALEMSKDELIHMSLTNLAWSRESRIEYRDIIPEAARSPGYEERFQRVYHAREKLDALPFYISDRGGMTVAEIRSEAQSAAQRFAAKGKRLEVICVDHLGLIKPETTYSGNKVAETEQISAALKLLAKEMDCAVVALSQLSRQVEGRGDKRPNLSDLRWSGAIEQDADVVGFVFREAYYLSKTEEDPDKEAQRQVRLEACRRKIELLIEKNRGGPTGNIEFYLRHRLRRRPEHGVRHQWARCTGTSVIPMRLWAA
jgi:replicative DNA helicase